MEQNFLSAKDYFAQLITRMEPEEHAEYIGMKHTRKETAYRDRTFVVYRMVNRKPEQIDLLRVCDFLVNDSAGASCEIRSDQLDERITVGYAPIRLFSYPIYAFIPLYTSINWSVKPNGVGSLGFDICLRTQSRIHLRERGITYCETGPRFGQEFEPEAALNR